MIMTFNFANLAVWMSWISLLMLVVPGIAYGAYMYSHPDSEKNLDVPLWMDADDQAPVIDSHHVPHAA